MQGHVWAAVGGFLLLIELYLVVKWVTGPYFTSVPVGPDDPPGWMKASLIATQVVSAAALAVLLYVLIVRPWRRDRQVRVEGLLAISFLLTSVYDPISNYMHNWLTYNSYFFNRGSVIAGVPGWQSFHAPGRMQAWPIFAVATLYPLWILAWVYLGSRTMRKIKEVRPRTGVLTQAFLAWLTASAIHFGLQSVFARVGFVGEAGGVAIFEGRYFQHPISDFVCAGFVGTALACLYHFRNDKGELLFERGLDRVSTSAKAVGTRFLAVFAGVQLTILLLYHLPMLLYSPSALPMPVDIAERSYLTNGLYDQHGNELDCPPTTTAVSRWDIC